MPNASPKATRPSADVSVDTVEIRTNGATLSAVAATTTAQTTDHVSIRNVSTRVSTSTHAPQTLSVALRTILPSADALPEWAVIHTRSARRSVKLSATKMETVHRSWHASITGARTRAQCLNHARDQPAARRSALCQCALWFVFAPVVTSARVWANANQFQRSQKWPVLVIASARAIVPAWMAFVKIHATVDQMLSALSKTTNRFARVCLDMKEIRILNVFQVSILIILH